MSEEVWKKLEYPNVFVSNKGRVKRIDGFIYTLQVCKSNGYNYVHLSFNNKTKAFKVSRLVALAFIENPENKQYVDHINTNRLDDRVENLRWATWKENNLGNAITKQRRLNSMPKERPWKKKPILQYDKQGNFIKEGASATDFGNSIKKDVSSNIIACINGKQHTAYGYKWRYKQLILGE